MLIKCMQGIPSYKKIKNEQINQYCKVSLEMMFYFLY